jgi:hypothetical protein
MKKKQINIPRDDDKSVLDWERFHARCKKGHATRQKVIAAHAARVKENQKEKGK